MFGNSINIICYFANGKKIANVTNRFIVAIAMLDFVCSLATIFISLFYLIVKFEQEIGSSLCYVESIAFLMPLSSDVILMSLNGFNRYIYITNKKVSIC